MGRARVVLGLLALVAMAHHALGQENTCKDIDYDRYQGTVRSNLYRYTCNSCKLAYTVAPLRKEKSYGFDEAQRNANREFSEEPDLDPKVPEGLSESFQRDLSERMVGVTTLVGEYNIVEELHWSVPAQAQYVCEGLGCCEPPPQRSPSEMERAAKLLAPRHTMLNEPAGGPDDVTKEYLQRRSEKGPWKRAWRKVKDAAMKKLGDGTLPKRCIKEVESTWRYNNGELDLSQMFQDIPRANFLMTFTVDVGSEEDKGDRKVIGQELEYFFLNDGLVRLDCGDEMTLEDGKCRLLTVQASMAMSTNAGDSVQQRGVDIGKIRNEELKTREVHRFLSAVFRRSNSRLFNDNLKKQLARAYQERVDKQQNLGLIVEDVYDWLALHAMMMSTQDLGNSIFFQFASRRIPFMVDKQGPFPGPLSLLILPGKQQSPAFNVVSSYESYKVPILMHLHTTMQRYYRNGVDVTFKYFPTFNKKQPAEVDKLSEVFTAMEAGPGESSSSDSLSTASSRVTRLISLEGDYRCTAEDEESTADSISEAVSADFDDVADFDDFNDLDDAEEDNDVDVDVDEPDEPVLPVQPLSTSALEGHQASQLDQGGRSGWVASWLDDAKKFDSPPIPEDYRDGDGVTTDVEPSSKASRLELGMHRAPRNQAINRLGIGVHRVPPESRLGIHTALELKGPEDSRGEEFTRSPESDGIAGPRDMDDSGTPRRVVAPEVRAIEEERSQGNVKDLRKMLEGVFIPAMVRGPPSLLRGQSTTRKYSTM